jgi:hypothetical protein
VNAAYRRLVRRRELRRQVAHIVSEGAGAVIVFGCWAALLWLWKVTP